MISFLQKLEFGLLKPVNNCIGLFLTLCHCQTFILVLFKSLVLFLKVLLQIVKSLWHGFYSSFKISLSFVKILTVIWADFLDSFIILLSLVDKVNQLLLLTLLLFKSSLFWNYVFWDFFDFLKFCLNVFFRVVVEWWEFLLNVDKCSLVEFFKIKSWWF